MRKTIAAVEAEGSSIGGASVGEGVGGGGVEDGGSAGGGHDPLQDARVVIDMDRVSCVALVYPSG